MQDYHLALTPRQLRERRPDLRIGHFSHTPWAPPEYFCLLPDAIAREVLLGYVEELRNWLSGILVWHDGCHRYEESVLRHQPAAAPIVAAVLGGPTGLGTSAARIATTLSRA